MLNKSKSSSTVYTNQSNYYKNKLPSFLNAKIFNLNGHLRKMCPGPISKEIKKFNKFSKKLLPDSNRVLIPNKDIYNIPHHSRQQSKFNADSKDFNYISNIDYNVKQRTMSALGKETYDFTNKSNNNIKSKRQSKNTPFSNYSTTTQIYYLPGGVKRVEKDINDDKKEIHFSNNRIRNRITYKEKVKNDYNTNIFCLSGNTAKNKDNNIIKHTFRNSDSDIFNIKNISSNNNTIRESKKRLFPGKNNIVSPQSIFAVKS